MRGGLVNRERYQGIEILRGRGTRFSKRRLLGRFSNCVSYFLSACYAGLHLDRPDVTVALTDPAIIGLVASLAAAFLSSYPIGISFPKWRDSWRIFRLRL
jgi:hypothetical protein